MLKNMLDKSTLCLRTESILEFPEQLVTALLEYLDLTFVKCY